MRNNRGKFLDVCNVCGQKLYANDTVCTRPEWETILCIHCAHQYLMRQGDSETAGKGRMFSSEREIDECIEKLEGADESGEKVDLLGIVVDLLEEVRALKHGARPKKSRREPQVKSDSDLRTHD